MSNKFSIICRECGGKGIVHEHGHDHSIMNAEVCNESEKKCPGDNAIYIECADCFKREVVMI